MLFNSVDFLLFFLVVYSLYLVLRHRWQNWFLIVASCAFYAAWNWKFLLLMFVSISTDFFCSNYIARTDDPLKKRFWLWLSIGVNLAILGFFKYFNFFAGQVQGVLQAFHFLPDSFSMALNIVLPVGVSFYTFEAISYVVDVYRGQIRPAQRYWDYVLFVIYFPHLIAGPIMRAKDFLPQIVAPRVFRWEQFYEGCHLFFWGLFEKVFIADNLAKIVNPVFAAQGPYHGDAVLIALYAFAFQIFCDFDGYSNMARGLGKCMGFEISINFRIPYFSKDPHEFWQRWHISLSSWFRDYVYIPLGGNRCSVMKMSGNLLVTMLLCGFWHGASWMFLFWGGYHAVILIGHHLIALWRGGADKAPDKEGDRWRLLKVFFFFHLVVIGWLLFRAPSVEQAWGMFCAIFTNFHGADFIQMMPRLLGFIVVLLGVQWGQWKSGDLLFMARVSPFFRIAFYALLTYLMVGFGVMNSEEFIYFQF
ncbi:MAG: MBOAT family O-acyltransferase [Candidatus Omnitrophota bacterium]